jgi:hypothetical protein
MRFVDRFDDRPGGGNGCSIGGVDGVAALALILSSSKRAWRSAVSDCSKAE